MEKLSPAEAQRVADLPLREAMKAIASTTDVGSPSASDSDVLDDVVGEPNDDGSCQVDALRKTSALLETFAAQLDEKVRVGSLVLRKLASSLNRSLKLVRAHQTALERRHTGDGE
jgi:hypothetical protein